MKLKAGQRWHDPSRGYFILIDKDTEIVKPVGDYNFMFPFKYQAQGKWIPGGFRWDRFLSEKGDLRLLKNRR